MLQNEVQTVQESHINSLVHVAEVTSLQRQEV